MNNLGSLKVVFELKCASLSAHVNNGTLNARLTRKSSNTMIIHELNY